MMTEILPETCPKCGAPTGDLVVPDPGTKDRPGAPRVGRIVRPDGCADCLLYQKMEFARLEDLHLGGKGEWCPECFEPLTKQGRKALRELQAECRWCLNWKRRNAERAGGHAAEAARRVPKEESMTSESRSLVVADPKRAAIQLKARFSQDLTNDAAIQEFADICAFYKLDPFMGEIVPFQGRPYVTAKGTGRKIAERFPGQLVSIACDIAPQEDYDRFRVDKEGWLAFAIVQRKGQQPIKRYALVTKAEARPSDKETPTKQRHIVKEPWDMAMNRARHRALRDAFPDAISLEMPSYEAIGAGEQPDGDVIDTTAREVTGEPTAEVPERATPPVDEKGPDDPEAEQRKRFWATARGLKTAKGQPVYKGGEQVHLALGLPPEEGAINNVWLPKADELGVPRPEAWALATDCLEQVTKLMQDGESLEAALAAVAPLGQLERVAEERAERQEAVEQQEALPLE